jgi:hypothetical protein
VRELARAVGMPSAVCAQLDARLRELTHMLLGAAGTPLEVPGLTLFGSALPALLMAEPGELWAFEPRGLDFWTTDQHADMRLERWLWQRRCESRGLDWERPTGATSDAIEALDEGARPHPFCDQVSWDRLSLWWDRRVDYSFLDCDYDGRRLRVGDPIALLRWRCTGNGTGDVFLVRKKRFVAAGFA